LEKENVRLQNLVNASNKEKVNLISQGSKTFIDNLANHKNSLYERFINPRTGTYNEEAKLSLKDMFKNEHKSIVKNHKKLLDHVFELIVDNLYPVCKFNYWKDLNEDYCPDFNLIKKYQKLRKYEKFDFISSNKFNELDQFVSAFEPSK